MFTISKLLLDQILFPYFYETVTTRTAIILSVISSYQTADHTKKIFRNFRHFILTIKYTSLEIINGYVTLPVKIHIIITFSFE